VGSGVATPVWFVAENGHLLIETDANSFKVRRIRQNPKVLVAPCTASGRVRGDELPADAEFLPDGGRERVERLFARKYRWDRILILPVYRAVQRLRGKGGPQERSKPVALSITLD
jgi:uncharacterized protein